MSPSRIPLMRHGSQFSVTHLTQPRSLRPAIPSGAVVTSAKLALEKTERRYELLQSRKSVIIGPDATLSWLGDPILRAAKGAIAIPPGAHQKTSLPQHA